MIHLIIQEEKLIAHQNSNLFLDCVDMKHVYTKHLFAIAQEHICADQLWWFKINNDAFCRYLKNVTIENEPGKPPKEFTQDGALKAAELKIMNLRPALGAQSVWEEVSEKLHTIPEFYLLCIK